VDDDDLGSRRSIERMIEHASLSVRSLASGSEFLTHYGDAVPSCLALDLRMPEVDSPRLVDAAALPR
jgi:FixJ family two-component response regulator